MLHPTWHRICPIYVCRNQIFKNILYWNGRILNRMEMYITAYNYKTKIDSGFVEIEGIR